MKTLSLPRAYALPPRRLSLVNRIHALLGIRASRKALGDLDTHLLNDIGLTRAEADKEAGRPIWDAPSRWLR